VGSEMRLSTQEEKEKSEWTMLESDVLVGTAVVRTANERIRLD
jgi:hypothetical protein